MNGKVESSLEWNFHPAIGVLGFLVLAVAFVFSYLAWKRSGWRPRTGLLEGLRMLILIGVVLTLLQPEWRRLYKPDLRPVIGILWDDSGSMDTKDVTVTNAEGQQERRARRAIVEELLQDERWAGLEERFELVNESFSSSLPTPRSATDIHGALESALERYSELAGVVLVSDGDWNAGEPPLRAATRLRLREAPVFSVAVGSGSRLPDLDLERVDAPAFAVVNKPLRVNFTIESSLPTEQITSVTLRASTGEQVSEPITIPAMGEMQGSINWTPANIGEVELELTVPEVPGEFDLENNIAGLKIDIRREKIRVLLVEGFPRWEYRYLRNALVRDPGVEVECLLFHPSIRDMGGGAGYLESFPTTEALAEFDVVFLGDVGLDEGQLSSSELDQLIQLVKNQASGLVFLPGFRGGHHSFLDHEIGVLYPVQLDRAQTRGWGAPVPGRFQLTNRGTRSLLTRLENAELDNSKTWESLPGFQWYAAVSRAKAGTEVLAVHNSQANEFGRLPLIVTKTYGAGKVLFMGTDGAWRWRKGLEDKYHYRFWGQVARWMAYQRNMAQGESMRLFYSPERPEVGDVVTLNANVMSPGGEPLQEATVAVRFLSPSGNVDTVSLRSAGEESWGLFTGTFEPKEPGEHQVVMECAETPETLETTLSVQGAEREKLGEPVNLEVLQELAQVTRGKLLTDWTVDAVVSSISNLPEVEAVEQRIRLWAHWAWIFFLIFLMGAFWVGRKMSGVL